MIASVLLLLIFASFCGATAQASEQFAHVGYMTPGVHRKLDILLGENIRRQSEETLRKDVARDGGPSLGRISDEQLPREDRERLANAIQKDIDEQQKVLELLVLNAKFNKSDLLKTASAQVALEQKLSVIVDESMVVYGKDELLRGGKNVGTAIIEKIRHILCDSGLSPSLLNSLQSEDVSE